MQEGDMKIKKSNLKSLIENFLFEEEESDQEKEEESDQEKEEEVVVPKTGAEFKAALEKGDGPVELGPEAAKDLEANMDGSFDRFVGDKHERDKLDPALVNATRFV